VLTAGGAKHGSRWCFLLLARGSLQRTAKERKTTGGGGGGALLRRQTRKKQRAWRRRDAVWLCVCLSMNDGPFSMNSCLRSSLLSTLFCPTSASFFGPSTRKPGPILGYWIGSTKAYQTLSNGPRPIIKVCFFFTLFISLLLKKTSTINLRCNRILWCQIAFSILKDVI
jgi:hypothetical protein